MKPEKQLKTANRRSQIEIRRVSSPHDLESLFRFRYSIYVEEMQRVQKFANHLSKRIEEPFDETGVNFIAVHSGQVIGCIRSNLGIDTDFGEYEELYGMRCIGPYFPRYCNVNTKLMVSPKYRRTGLMIRLATTAYEYVRRNGIVCDFIDCNPHLENQFAHFGYRQYRDRIQHPEYGDVMPLLLLGVDLEHLEEQGSPFTAIERTLERQPDVVAYFRENVFKTTASFELMSGF